jgi:wobble nucleotide-excising tRNase
MQLLEFNLTRDTVTYFLQVLDPFNHQRITFSECVQLFSAHMVNNTDEDEVFEV